MSNTSDRPIEEKAAVEVAGDQYIGINHQTQCFQITLFIIVALALLKKCTHD